MTNNQTNKELKDYTDQELKTTSNQQELTQKIQAIKELIQKLDKLAASDVDNTLTGIFSNLLRMITDMFEDVDQRLKALEKSQETN
jgi:ABC-type phosphate transport system auxiliary subunit